MANSMAKVFSFPSSRPSPPSDAAARTEALNVHRSFIVEAPAGSGKTGLLVQRFLTLLADDSVEAPEEVLAITFTRKATAEMQQRVLEELQSAQKGAPVPEGDEFARQTRSLADAALLRSERLGWGILSQPGRLNIRSILSVCVELAHSLPLLSGGGTMQPVESPYPLYLQTARQTLLQLGGSDRGLHNALRTVLLHRDGNIADCERLIVGMLHTREQWGELVPLSATELDDAYLEQQVRPRLEQTLNAIVCGGLQRALQAFPADSLAELTAFAHRHSHELGYNGNDSPIAPCRDKQSPPQATAEHLQHWIALLSLLFTKSGGWRASFNINQVGFALSKQDKAELKDIIDGMKDEARQAALCDVLALPPASYPDEQWVVTKALFHLLRHALLELKLLFAQRGVCDFSEFSLAARAALHEGEGSFGLTLPAGGRLRHLLVDEMQDTSTSQYGLIEALTQSWDGHSQTLFLVGDPKQSIYLFRAARVERFLRTVRERRLGEVPLAPLQLTANFRSQAALVEGFNETFGGTPLTGPIFPPPADPALRGNQAPDSTFVDVPFVMAAATRPPTQAHGIVWHPAILNPVEDDYAAQEAREIRRIVQQRLDLPLPDGRSRPWSIAVLARARGHLDAVVQEFKAHNGKREIAFRGIDLDPLDKRPEVLDALALTRALLHPADRIAWLAVLHAPWCGLGMADLLALTGEGPGCDTHQTIADLAAAGHTRLSQQGQRLLKRTWDVLEAAIRNVGRTPLSVHVERTWLSLGGDVSLTSVQRSNVQRFFSVLRELELEDDRIQLNTLTSRLQTLYAEPRSGDEIQVDLTTIHKAKGLEWDLVLVPGLHRRTRHAGTGLLNWLEIDAVSPQVDASILLAPIWGKGEDSDKLNDWLRSVRSRRDRAEEKRLFYVAATRAREELHLFAAANRTSSGELAPPLPGTLLHACWPAAEQHFATLNQAAQEVPQSVPYIADEEDDEYDEPLSLAASAPETEVSHADTASMLQRLPPGFDPAQRFADAAAHKLAYTPASALSSRPAFARPEGSFAVRAFGNVVHRYLQLLAERLAVQPVAQSASQLIAELPGWQLRLETSLRGEGLPPAVAAREAARALSALTLTLNDPTGLWLLSPHTQAASEGALTTAAPGTAGLRVDRTFVAGPQPLSSGQSCIWIIDFKTSEQGSRSPAAFAAAERAKYTAQLETYAALRRSLPGGNLLIRLGLFYPLGPTLIHWESAGDCMADPVSALGG